MKNEYISNNKIIDPQNKKQFQATSGLYNLRKYNYASKFDRIVALGYYGKYIDSVTGEEKNCITGCQSCWEVGYCFECKTGYYLKGRKCIKNEYYYFSSPNILSSTLDADISLIPEMQAQNKATVNLWIKPYGFSKSNGVTIFNIGTNLEITFSGNMQNETAYPYSLGLFDNKKLVAND